MSSTTDRPKVDVGALAGALYGDAASALADTVVLSMDWLEERDQELNQIQKTQIVRTALLAAANLEAAFARTLIDDLERKGVLAWGLSADLENILNRKVGDDAA